MKKIVVLIGLIAILSACQMSTQTNVKSVGRNLTYFKDARTGLCFASVNSNSTQGGSYTSIACVPCDSLKNVEVKIIDK